MFFTCKYFPIILIMQISGSRFHGIWGIYSNGKNIQLLGLEQDMLYT